MHPEDAWQRSDAAGMDVMGADMSFRSSIAGLSNKLATNSLEDVDFKLLEMFDKGGSFDLPSGQDLGLDVGFLSEAAMPQIDHGAHGGSLAGGGRSQEGLLGLPPSGQPFQSPGLLSQNSLPAQLNASNSYGSSQSYPWGSSTPPSADSGPSLSAPLPLHGGRLSPASRTSLALSSPPGAGAEGRPAFPPIPAPRSGAPLPHRSARRASMPASAAGGVSNLIGGGGLHSLWENRSTPPLWSIGEGEAFGQLSPTMMRPALSAEEITVQQLVNGTTVSSERGGQDGGADGMPTGARRPRPSVRSASVGAHSDRPLSPGDLDLGLASAKAKERNRRAQKRFRERQKIKQMEAVQRVLELEAHIDQLRLEKTELSHRLKQELQRNGRTPDAGGPAASDTGSERQGGNNATGQESPTSSAERVLTLSVPSGHERSLTGSDIKRMSWPEYTFLYEAYLEEMAAMLIQAQGDSNTQAGQRLQRLTTELITVTAAILMHDPKAKGRLYCQPLMSAPAEAPLASPDRQFWNRVTVAMCLSRQQRQNCLRLRAAHMHKMQEIIQQRFHINQMLQSSLPKLDYSPLAAREHLTALELSDQLQRNLRQEQGLQLELSTTFFSQALTPIQMATAATESYPWWPDKLAILHCIAHQEGEMDPHDRHTQVQE